MKKNAKIGLNTCSLIIYLIGIGYIICDQVIIYVVWAILSALLCFWTNCIVSNLATKYKVLLLVFIVVIMIVPIYLRKIPRKVPIQDFYIKYDVDVLYNRKGSGTYSFDVDVMPENYTEKLFYKSSNKNVLEIDENGKFKIKGIGKATLTVYNEKKTITRSKTITVKKYVPLESFELDTEEINISIGEEQIINVIPSPKEATGDMFFFEKEYLLNDTISIERIGLNSAKITAKERGCARLEVYDVEYLVTKEDKYKSKYIKVCVDPLKELEIEDEFVFSGTICNRTDREFKDVFIMYPLAKSKFDTTSKEFATAKKDYLQMGECWHFYATNENVNDYSYHKKANIYARDEKGQLFVFPDPFELNDWEN